MSLAKKSSRRSRRSLGAVIVEFALLIPVLVMFLIGTLEVGRMVMVQQLLTGAARTASRAAAMPGSTVSVVTSDVRAYLASAGITAPTITIVPDCAAAIANTPITVTVSVPFADVSWLQGLFFNAVNLHVQATMRKEG